jgi:hypothetical protein
MDHRIPSTENNPGCTSGSKQHRAVATEPAPAKGPIMGPDRTAEFIEFASVTDAKDAADAVLATCGRPKGNKQLIRLCAEFRRLERIALDRWEDDGDDWANLLEAQRILAMQISSVRPATLDDYRAIVRAILGWKRGLATENADDCTGRDAHLLTFLIWSLAGVSHRKARKLSLSPSL